jgi:hypothetical protein
MAMTTEMPDLIGEAEVQATWATVIRSVRLSDLPAWVAAAAELGGATEKQAEQLLELLHELFAGQTRAWWWIDTRQLTLDDLIDKADLDSRMGKGRQGPSGKPSIFDVFCS